MNRRRLLLGASAATALGLHAGRTAFAKGKLRVGVLTWVNRSAASVALLRKDLERSMADLGFVDGQNISYEWRSAERDFSRLRTQAAELVRLQPDVIFARNELATRALAQLTTTIPIVGIIEDPVENGYSREGLPSRNVTGVALQEFERLAKMLETLKLIIPGLSRIGIVVSRDPLILDGVARLEKGARRLGLEPYTTLVSSRTDIESAFASMRTNGIRAVRTLYATAYTDSDSIAALAIRHGVALIGTVQAGGLLSLDAEFENVAAATYATDRLAALLAKILRSIPISQIPFEFPKKFVLSINLKTAAALGLRIPQEVLLRTDRIIE